MNFQKHYFREEKLEEKISDVVSDVGGAGAGKIAKAAAKGVGRGIANIARGALGRTKEMAFEPNWLKVLKPIDQKTYQSALKQYANWKSQKTKLGPKKKIEIKDLRDGVLGDFSGDDFVDILAKYDSSMKNIDMESEIKPQISIYLLNNGGKVIFMNLPVGEDGKKRKFAMGLDNKGERIFRLIHGMTFQDFSLRGDEEAVAEKDKGKETLKYKYEIDDKEFERLAPDEGEKFVRFKLADSNQSFSLLDMFTEEVLGEGQTVKYLIKKDDKWMIATDAEEKEFNDPNPKHKYWAVKGSEVGLDRAPLRKADAKDKELQKELDDWIKKETGGDNKIEKTEDNPDEKKKSYDKADVKEFGELALDLKDELQTTPNVVKPDDKIQYGWRYLLKNGGVIFVYQSKEDEKNYIKYDDKARQVVKDKGLVTKYGMTKAVKPE